MRKKSISIKKLLEYPVEVKPLISVIIPVYNVEKYLRRCLNSVVVQTYEHIEIILVDDGSTDDSGDICDEYADRDKRIVVIHQENQGQSAARNKGVDIAKGSYIAFVDSDDFVIPDYIALMFAAAIRYQADIVQTRISICYDTSSREKHRINTSVTLFQPGKNAPNEYLYKVALYAKLYQSDIVKQNRFQNYRTNEDDAIYYRYAFRAERIAVIDYCTYFYYQTPVSVMRGTVGDQRTDYIPIYYDRIRFYEERQEAQLVLGSRERFCLISMLNYAAYKKNKTNSKDLCRLLQIFREQYPYLRQYQSVSFARRICYTLFNRFPNAVSAIINVLR